MAKQRVLILQPIIEPLGGSNAVAAWALQALRYDYAVTVLTGQKVDFDDLNSYFGTRLAAHEFDVITIPQPMRWVYQLDPDPFSFQLGAYLMRMAKRLAPAYDVSIMLDGEADLGRPGIQYFHYPWLKRLYQQPNPDLDGVGWLGQMGYVATGQVRPWRFVSQFSFERMKQNLSLVNSEWTAAVVKQVYGIDTLVLYPPVHNDFPVVSWEQREPGFVCIGRISTEKRYEQIIAILSQVRSQIPDMHLHIIGTFNDNSPANREYYTTVKRLVRDNAAWVSLHEAIPREELVRLVSQHRYGIHAMQDEHFGIAVGEMVMGGCIVFVPDDGGQVEIVNRDPRLVYTSDRDAVAKIMRVIQDPALQTDLRAMLQRHKTLFTANHFMQHLRHIVADFVQAREPQRP